METIRTCPQCQQPLSADAPDGLCPQCLLKAATGPLPTTAGVGLTGDIIDIGDPAEVAKKLPQFEILEMLGRGGMGVVYKARQIQLDRLVALKILPPVDALSPDFVARFTREARSLAKLNHPNIVNVHDFGETDGLYYIVMEYVEGTNLRQLLETRKLSAVEALAIIPKICDALEYAHEEGFVHRDIKPENLLIDKKGRVKIADFGLAKLLRREPLDMTLTLSGMALGTLRYMAPEQMEKPESVDHRADLYSLGVVIYEMLTGETPVGRYELPSQKARVDVRLDQIVLHALEREPSRRYQHASEVREDMEKVTSEPGKDSAPTTVRSSTRGEMPRDFRQQDAREILALVMAVLSGLSVVGILAALLGLMRILVPAFRAGMELGPVEALGRDAWEFAGILLLSLMALFLLPKARGQGRDRLARINAANLVVVGVLLTFACASHWFGLGLPYWVGGIYSVIAFVCWLLLCGRDVKAAFGAAPFAAASEMKHGPPPSEGEKSQVQRSDDGDTGAVSSERTLQPAPTALVDHLNDILGFFMTPQPGYVRQVGIPMMIFTGVWMIVKLFVTVLVPEENEAAHLYTLLAGLVGIPLGILILSLRRVALRKKQITRLGRAKSVVSTLGFVAIVASIAVLLYMPHRTDFGNPYAFAGMPAPFVKGPDGPVLTASFVKKSGFTPMQVVELNKTFQSYYREFVSLERRHTEVSQDSQGHIHIAISPFPEESLALAQRMSQELRGLVGKDVIPAPQSGMLTSIGLFRHAGEATVTAELWKQGDYYYFKEGRIGAPNSAHMNEGGKAGRSTSSKKLNEAIPEEYQLYWKEMPPKAGATTLPRFGVVSWNSIFARPPLLPV